MGSIAMSESPDEQRSECNTWPSQTSDLHLGGFSNLITRTEPPNACSMYPTPTQATALLEAFISNVDPLVQFLHVPSLRQQINSQFSSQKGRSRQRRMHVLTAAVFFASVTSMTEEECQTHLQMSRDSAVSGFRTVVEDGKSISSEDTFP